MRIAYIVPNLQQAGPIIVVQSLVKFLAHENYIVVYYIDECDSPISMNCEVKKIFYDEPIPFDDFDIIHCHTAKADLYGFFWMKEMHHAVLLTTIHQDSFYTEKLRIGKITGGIYTRIWLKIQGQFDGIITISNQIKALYQKYFDVPISVIYNGVNCEYSEIDETVVSKIKAFKKDGAILLGTYALITKRKGLIQVLQLLVDSPIYQFLIIGNGPEVGALRQFSEDNGISDRVLYIEHIDKPYNYIQNVDIYIMPSCSEAFGLAVVEAALQHKGIVCSDLDSFHELFPNNEVGFFKLGNITSMDIAIQKVYQNTKQYGLMAFNRVSAHFTASVMAMNTINYYQRSKKQETHIKISSFYVWFIRQIRNLFCLVVRMGSK